MSAHVKVDLQDLRARQVIVVSSKSLGEFKQNAISCDRLVFIFDLIYNSVK